MSGVKGTSSTSASNTGVSSSETSKITAALVNRSGKVTVNKEDYDSVRNQGISNESIIKVLEVVNPTSDFSKISKQLNTLNKNFKITPDLASLALYHADSTLSSASSSVVSHSQSVVSEESREHASSLSHIKETNIDSEESYAYVPYSSAHSSSSIAASSSSSSSSHLSVTNTEIAHEGTGESSLSIATAKQLSNFTGSITKFLDRNTGVDGSISFKPNQQSERSKITGDSGERIDFQSPPSAGQYKGYANIQIQLGSNSYCKILAKPEVNFTRDEIKKAFDDALALAQPKTEIAQVKGKPKNVQVQYYLVIDK